MSDAGSGPRDWQLQVRAPGGSFTNACNVQTTPSSGKYGCAWNTSGLADGTYELRAQMRDNASELSGGPNVSYTPVVTTMVDNTAPALLQDVAPSVGSQDYSEELAESDLTEIHFVQGDGSGSGVAGTTLAYNTASDGSASGQWLSSAAAPATGEGQTTTTWESSDMSDGMHLVRATSTDRAGNSSQTQFQVVATSSRRNCSTAPRPGVTTCYAGFGYGTPGASMPRDTTELNCDLYAGPAERPSVLAQRVEQLPDPGPDEVRVGCLRAGTTGTLYDEERIEANNITIQSEPGTQAEWQGRIVLWGDNITLRNLKLRPQNLLEAPQNASQERERCAWDAPSNPDSPLRCAAFGITITGEGVRLINNDITTEGTPGNTEDARKTHTNCVDVTDDKTEEYSPPRFPRDIEIKDNMIYKCGWPTFEDAHEGEEDGGGGGHWHGVYIAEADGAEIVNNIFYGNADRAVQLFPDALNTKITNNTMDDNGEGIDVATRSSNTTIMSNIVTNSRDNGDQRAWPPGAYYSNKDPDYNVYAAGGAVGSNNIAKNNCLWDKWSGTGAYVQTDALQFVGSQAYDPNYRNPGAHDYRPLNPRCLSFGATPPGAYTGYGVQSRLKTPDFFPAGTGYHLGVGSSVYGSHHRIADTGVNDGNPCANRKNQAAPSRWTVYSRYTKPGGSTRASHCFKTVGVEETNTF